MQNETFNMGELFNRWNDNDIMSLRTLVHKLPLQADASTTGGTFTLTTGTSGTLHGTNTFNVAKGWTYILKSLSFNVNQSGTFGTQVLRQILIDDVPLGTLGTVANFQTSYGDWVVCGKTIKIASLINCGTGVIGTYTTDLEVVGLKFPTLLNP